MLELRNPRIAIPVVLFAGLLWSFGPLVVRYMDNPQLVPWQYIFGRGLTIFILLNLYLFFEEGKNFYKNYLKIGLSEEKSIKDILTNGFDKKKNFTRFVKSQLSTTKNGKINVEILKGQESFKIKSFVKSNIWVLLPSGKSKFKKGDLVDCFFPNLSNQNLVQKRIFVVENSFYN